MGALGRESCLRVGRLYRQVLSWRSACWVLAADSSWNYCPPSRGNGDVKKAGKFLCSGGANATPGETLGLPEPNLYPPPQGPGHGPSYCVGVKEAPKDVQPPLKVQFWPVLRGRRKRHSRAYRVSQPPNPAPSGPKPGMSKSYIFSDNL